MRTAPKEARRSVPGVAVVGVTPARPFGDLGYRDVRRVCGAEGEAAGAAVWSTADVAVAQSSLMATDHVDVLGGSMDQAAKHPGEPVGTRGGVGARAGRVPANGDAE
ncbi:hypothetical protein Psuf_079770 [Phytohabitans suffuscus]|uniref:Uncharacterized protein n=1 Tax=Phytohabitans suffuscus TaxID=624315 RepID=A0A6F8YX82_9ACTN|nr:hypothetical protein Psuf_079770 [Phytohabitans suffuscus]